MEMMPETSQKPRLLFIARYSDHDNAWDGGRAEATRQRLNKALDRTEEYYKMEFGPFSAPDAQHLTLACMPSNKHIPKSGYVFHTIHTFLGKARNENRPVKIVLNGFDGLTTNAVSFLQLFEEYEDMAATISVFHGNPRIFTEAVLSDVVRLFNGTYDEDDKDVDKNASLIYQKILTISAIKTKISDDTVALRKESNYRNCAPEIPVQQAHRYVPRDGSTRNGCACNRCGDTFEDDIALRNHQSRCAKEHQCMRCHNWFKQLDCLKKHTTSGPCGENRKTRPRFSDPESQRVSIREKAVTYWEGPGNESYFSFARRPAGLPDWTGEWVCDGELFCRFPGCENDHNFVDTSKLKRHYDKVHDITFEKLTKARGVPKMLDEVLVLQWFTYCIAKQTKISAQAWHEAQRKVDQQSASTTDDSMQIE
ncbi:hypothetical protein B9Z65_2173 [Elsinoe australis]|uniref:Uncharacterized protein n=1 Tax=Elsinoe australis TaxID=40998 RepID=A0A2P7YN84_9PEZI|nr:hypothetical protein B9Z65_2173 [Elsinoe australis]